MHAVVIPDTAPPEPINRPTSVLTPRGHCAVAVIRLGYELAELDGEDRAYISPSGMFVNLDGEIRRPVRVEIELPANWKQISTGLEPVKGKPNALEAADFDTLYDCPILIGNQEYLRFDVKGVPHYVAIENVAAEPLLDAQRTFGGQALREVGASAPQHAPCAEDKEPGNDR